MVATILVRLRVRLVSWFEVLAGALAPAVKTRVSIGMAGSLGRASQWQYGQTCHLKVGPWKNEGFIRQR